jgi:copper transport protein
MLVLGAVPAWSHSELTRSDPTNGGMVAEGRSFVTLWFAEAVSLDASTFELRTTDGRLVRTRASAEGHGTVVRLDTSPLDRSGYELDWRVLSLDDGHPSSGSLLFGAGTRPDVLPASGSGLPGAALLLVRWLDLGSMLLAIGALAVSGRVLGSLGAVGRPVRRRVRKIGAVASLAVVGTGLLTPFVRTLRPGSTPGSWVDETWVTMALTPWGHLWLVREAALVVAAGAMWSWGTHRQDPARRASRVALGALASAAVLESWAGHASGLPRETAPAVLASAAHLVAAGVWAGGLVLLTVCLVPLMRRLPDLRGPILASVWRTFSPWAAIASVVLVATGLYQTGRHVPDLAALTSTLYGRAVAAKVVLVLGALAFAGVNTLLVNPRLAARVAAALRRSPGWAPVSLGRFGITVTAEALVLVTAVAAAALVTSVPTAREVGTAHPASAPRSDNVDGLFVTFEAVPDGPDRSRLVVRMRSTTLPEPAPVTGVDVLLRAPDGATTRVPLALVEPGRYETGTPAPAPGRRRASIAVHREGLPDAVARAEWHAAPTGSGGAGSLGTALTAVSLLMLVALVGVVRSTGLRRPSPSTSRIPLGQTEESHR